MDVLEEQHGEAVVFTLKGRLDGSTAPELQNLLMSRLGTTAVTLIDCTALDYISSAGLRVMLLGKKESSKAKHAFGICCLQEEVHEVFRLSGFISIIDTFDSREEALAKLAPA
jgi:anti-anti-sigma factor